MPDFELKNLNSRAKNLINGIARSEIVFQAILVGLIAGFLAVAFRFSIEEVSKSISRLNFIWLPVICSSGGALAGLIIQNFSPESKGSGIPFVKLILARLGTEIRLRSILTKFFAGIIGIGTGISLGREGPTVHLGAGAGALVSKIFKKTGTAQNSLIAAGAGAGIGATFNAPIAGTIFVIEELVHKFSAPLLFPTVIATVTAATLARHFYGNSPAFDIPHFEMLNEPRIIAMAIIIGIVSGVLGILFVKNIFLNIEIFNKIKNIPLWLKPALAGFVVGSIGMFLPYLLGPGNNAVTALLENKITIFMILAIFLGKFILTSFCFGSGAAGGLFLPTIMLGSFSGYFAGNIANLMGFSVDPIVTSLIGMCAFMAGVVRTPLTAVVMVFEMTGDYTHILPFFLSAAIADLIAENAGSDSIYSSLIFKSSKTKHNLADLSSFTVKGAMSEDISTFSENISIKMAIEKANDLNHGGFPVVSRNYELLGFVTKSSLENALMNNNPANTAIKKIMDPSPCTISQYAKLDEALFQLHSNHTAWLVVLDRNKVLGILTRYDISKKVAH